MSWQTPNPSPTEDTNRRFTGRHSVIWSARFCSDRGETKCIVLDFSHEGVRLRFPNDIAVDLDLCDLDIPRMGRFTCELSWRRGNEMGLRILSMARASRRSSAVSSPIPNASPISATS